MLRIAMLSKWHVHAEGYAREFNSSGGAKVTAVWNEDNEVGREWAQRLGADYYESLDELLANDDIDAVCCCTPTTAHKEILIKAANAGKHIFTEKTLACTKADCLEIAQAIKKAGVTFTISFPQKSRAVVRFVKSCIDNGDFGTVTTVRIRNAHNGVSGGWLPEYWFEEKDAAGGAMMDLGCHAMYMLSCFCGEPKRITSIFNSVLGSKVDETAVCAIEFKNGAIGISETGFDSFCSPFTVEVHGTDGVFVMCGDDIKFKTKQTEKFQGGYIVPNRFPPESESPIKQFIAACENGDAAPDGLGLEEAAALAELLEKAYISHKTGETVIF